MANVEVFDWFDSYEYDNGNTQKLIQPGIYDFTVRDIQKGFYEGSDKIPACNALNMWINIEGEDVIKFDKFYLCSQMLWKIDSFLRCVGMETKSFTPLLHSTGAKGICHICKKSFHSGESNYIDRYVTPDDDVEFIRLRDFVIQRDGNKCRLCGKTGSLRVHHIIEKSADKTHMYNPDNLITVCPECHEKAHARHTYYKDVGGAF